MKDWEFLSIKEKREVASRRFNALEKEYLKMIVQPINMDVIN